MIQVKLCNNTSYNTSDLSMELKYCLNQIATTQNLRDQLVDQIYIITKIQQSINDDTITNNLDKFLLKYNNSISKINESIITKDYKLEYFNIDFEKVSYNKQNFVTNLAKKCQDVEIVFDQIARLNKQAIDESKRQVELQQQQNSIDDPYANNISINNSLLLNN